MEKKIIETIDNIAKALDASLTSPNEMDSNGEVANVVDGLFAISRSIIKLANVLEKQQIDVSHHNAI